MTASEHVDSQLTADERILRAALHRFAADGLGAPLRAVAADAGVSAGLIIHHFGSRENLLEACDQRALEVTRQEKGSLMTGGTTAMFAQLADAETYAPEVGYVLRRLQAGGPLVTALVDDFVDDAEEYLDAGVKAGLLSPSRDPRARARVLTETALGALLLQLPAQRAQMDLEELPRWLRSYTEQLMEPLLELYTTPLLTDSTLLDAYLAHAGKSAAAPPGTAPTDASPTSTTPPETDPPTDRSTP